MSNSKGISKERPFKIILYGTILLFIVFSIVIMIHEELKFGWDFLSNKRVFDYKIGYEDPMNLGIAAYYECGIKSITDYYPIGFQEEERILDIPEH